MREPCNCAVSCSHLPQLENLFMNHISFLSFPDDGHRRAPLWPEVWVEENPEWNTVMMRDFDITRRTLTLGWPFGIFTPSEGSLSTSASINHCMWALPRKVNNLRQIGPLQLKMTLTEDKSCGCCICISWRNKSSSLMGNQDRGTWQPLINDYQGTFPRVASPRSLTLMTWSDLIPNRLN